MQPIDPEKLLENAGKFQVVDIQGQNIWYLNKTKNNPSGNLKLVKTISRATGYNRRLYAYEITFVDAPQVFNKVWIKKDDQLLFQKEV